MNVSLIRRFENDKTTGMPRNSFRDGWAGAMGGEAGTGLEAISVIARLLAVAYLLVRRRK